MNPTFDPSKEIVLYSPESAYVKPSFGGFAVLAKRVFPAPKIKPDAKLKKVNEKAKALVEDVPLGWFASFDEAERFRVGSALHLEKMQAMRAAWIAARRQRGSRNFLGAKIDI